MNPPPNAAPPEAPFVNEVRLNWKNWLATIGLLAVIVFATPRVWKKVEKFETNSDYRIPYTLSKDYWLYERRLQKVEDPKAIFLLGDSVVWGEYVLPDGTLSHFLNQQTASTRFVNAGVNGLYPLAIEGLINSYAPLHHRKIILHCNLLWMSSPKADLHDPKPQQLNHSRLLSQFQKIPSYKADANERFSATFERHVQFLSWVTHLQTAYFEDKSIPAWTLVADENDPPGFPNAYKNPLSRITLSVPSAPADDPERGPASARHRAWTKSGGSPVGFDWVDPSQSLQWAAFQRALAQLKSRGNDVFVIIGPFNEHMINDESKPAFQKLRDAVIAHLQTTQTPFAKPAVLASDLYADGSHPLTAGYQTLATELQKDPVFQQWLSK